MHKLNHLNKLTEQNWCVSLNSNIYFYFLGKLWAEVIYPSWASKVELRWTRPENPQLTPLRFTSSHPLTLRLLQYISQRPISPLQMVSEAGQPCSLCSIWTSPFGQPATWQRDRMGGGLKGVGRIGAIRNAVWIWQKVHSGGRRGGQQGEVRISSKIKRQMEGKWRNREKGHKGGKAATKTTKIPLF